MKLHWQIVIALVAGVVVGGWFQIGLEGKPTVGLSFADGEGGAVIEVVAPDGAGAGAELAAGQVVERITRHRDDAEREAVQQTPDASALLAVLDDAAIGEALWFHVRGLAEPTPVIVGLDAASQRARWIEPFAFVADLFILLLKMLIVPIVLTSIITGVAGVGGGSDLRRLSLKTFAYYVTTSVLAIFLGLVLVNIIRPGDGAALGLRPTQSFEDVAEQSFLDVLRRMVPENVFVALSDNGQMLQVIFFALLFGIFVTRTAEPHRTIVKQFFQAAFEVMMKVAGFVLGLIPYGVFALLVKVVGSTGFGLFGALGLYMLTVAAGLVIHALITLPIILRLFARISPRRWASAMGPALLTAVSTSSSSVTLPVTLRTVEERGKVSNRTTSFVLPLGATINMDGTALYECVGVIFLAQYYEGISPFALTFAQQAMIVFMALMASIGAAGIPSAGLVMMLTILSALNLPVEGAALLLAVDRPLDMMRTMVNVWSDSCGAAVIARTEGETPLAEPEPALSG